LKGAPQPGQRGGEGCCHGVAAAVATVERRLCSLHHALEAGSLVLGGGGAAQHRAFEQRQAGARHVST
jgi:hypothetical protein